VDQVRQRAINQVVSSLGALQPLYLLVIDLVNLLHEPLVELIFVSGRQGLVGLAHQTLPVQELILLVANPKNLSDFRVILAHWWKSQLVSLLLW
jgi:hypothetical protein